MDARTATEQAIERLAAIEQRLGRLDEEIAAISKQAEKDSVEDEARIKASIEAERKRIVDAVSKDIAAAGSAAQRDLKRFAAGLAVDRAAQRMALTEDDDRALMQEFAQSLGQQARAEGKTDGCLRRSLCARSSPVWCWTRSWTPRRFSGSSMTLPPRSPAARTSGSFC